ncbi:hypothetical protein DXG01_005417 [Tephrocybe rancida]|nr:hypothetical protein DXG01_005417 [Tephrocybe rancida]
MRADIHFLTWEEWVHELNVLKGDIEDDVDSQKRRARKAKPSNLKTVTKITSESAKKSWQTLVAVYHTPETPFTVPVYLDTVHNSNNVNTLLDDTKWPFLSDLGTSKTIVCAQASELSSALRNWVGDKGRWPLIKKVVIRVQSLALSTGVILVDLPGFDDKNMARMSVAKEYQKSADHFFVAIPITRAVDSRSTQITKCDDVVVDEVSSNYDLNDDEEYAKLKQTALEWQSCLEDAQDKEVAASKRRKEYEDAVAAQNILETEEARPAKRQRHDTGYFNEGPGGSVDVFVTLAKTRDEKKRCEAGVRTSNYALKTFCSQYRSQETMESLIQSFHEDLEDGFAVSARDFQALKKNTLGDVTCFLTVRDTLIPALQEHCRALPLPRLRKYTQNALNTLERSTRSMVHTLQDLQRDDAGRSFLEAEWGSNAGLQPALESRLAKETTSMVEELKEHFQLGLNASCENAAELASQEMTETTEKLLKKLSWQRLRATFRRQGVHADLDINEEFAAPFISTIVNAWRATLDKDLFPGTEAVLHRITNHLLEELIGSCQSDTSKDYATAQADLALEEAASSLKALHREVAWQIHKDQRNISSSITSHIQEQLVEGYDEALKIKGKGSVKLQKEYFSDFVDGIKETVFHDLHDHILEGLDRLVLSIGSAVEEKLSLLAVSVHEMMASSWQESEISLSTEELADLRESVDVFHKELKTWLEESETWDTE